MFATKNVCLQHTMRVIVWYYVCEKEQVRRFKVASWISVTNNGRM